jgi:putative oxidoreductase
MATASRAAADVPAGSNDLGKLVLRVALGVLILLHGISKLTGGADFIVGTVTKAGLPAVLGYGVYIGEVLAPLLLIVGLFTRPAAIVVAINMLFAIFLVHAGDIGQLSKTGGWAIELQGMFLFASIAVALLGAGRYSVGGVAGRWN